MKKKTYKLKFKCLNCYHEWEGEVPFGVEVETGWLERSCWYGNELVYCPNCGCCDTKKNK